MIEVHSLQAPVYFALGLCLGAAIYFSLGWEPAWIAAGSVTSIALVSGVWLLRRAHPAWLRLLIIIAMGASAGIGLSKLHTDLRPAPPVNREMGPVMVEGWVKSVEPGANGVRLRLRVHAIGGERSDLGPREIRLTHTLSLNVAPGRFVRCWAVIRPPPEPGFPGDYAFNRQAFFEGLDGVG